MAAMPHNAPLLDYVIRLQDDRLRNCQPAQRLRPPASAVRRARLARDVLRDRNGALADGRDRDGLGADAVAGRAGAAWEALRGHGGGAMSYTADRPGYWNIMLALSFAKIQSGG